MLMMIGVNVGDRVKSFPPKGIIAIGPSSHLLAIGLVLLSALSGHAGRFYTDFNSGNLPDAGFQAMPWLIPARESTIVECCV